LNKLEIPFVLIETNEGLCREHLKDGVMVIQGDAKRHDVLQSAGIDRARGICIVIDNDADNLYITVTARALNPNVKIITRAGPQGYPNAIRNSGADEVIIPEYEGGLMTGRMIQKYYPVKTNLQGIRREDLPVHRQRCSCCHPERGEGSGFLMWLARPGFLVASLLAMTGG
jgi:voltage-gated potassium channel Kch